ncbi:urease accessory protein D isoform X2 [Magnolia sinica]|uniref:urease accessory protein D isoform X2 n=1 Tax=Magnolia sinica TaxID=86752 RepID=UPI00265AF998|nr:urease accessory protein D isoform X2 [Magnolia sinica]
MEGIVVVEKVGGKSKATRCFSKYPLKFIVPSKVASSKTDAVWIYSISYGGGIVSGDCISCKVSVGESCTAVLTTQASTKATVGSHALLVIIPDPVTCFSTARYSQKQIFRVASDSSLVIVDWLTSGRHESGEKWDFELYKSTNNIFLDGNEPLFLDSVLLEQGSSTSIADRMQDYQVIAMVILVGPKLKHVQNQVQEDVKKMMTKRFYAPASPCGTKIESEYGLPKPALIASCSVFGPKDLGVVVRISAVTTESVYEFLRHHLASMESLLGASPYCRT